MASLTSQVITSRIPIPEAYIKRLRPHLGMGGFRMQRVMNGVLRQSVGECVGNGAGNLVTLVVSAMTGAEVKWWREL